MAAGIACALLWSLGVTFLHWTNSPAFPPAVISSVVVPFWVGRWVARQAPGREIAASLTLAVLAPLVGYAMVWVFARFAGSQPTLSSHALLQSILCPSIFYVAAAVLVRQRAQRTPPEPGPAAPGGAFEI